MSTALSFETELDACRRVHHEDQFIHDAILKKFRVINIKVDVIFVSQRNFEGQRVRCFQYTASDAHQIRVLKIYPRHNQQNAIKFIDYVIDNILPPFGFWKNRLKI